MVERTSQRPEAPDDGRAVPASTAWGRFGLGLLVLWGCQGLLAQGLSAQLAYNVFGVSLTGAAVLGVSGLVIGGAMFWFVLRWQQAHGETLRDLGWRRPTTVVAIVVAIAYGLAWTELSLMGRLPDPFSWQRLVMLVTLPFAAASEEFMVRGFMMEQLRRGRVPALVQVLVTAVAMGVYHGVVGLHFSPLYAATSTVLFGLLSALFLLGRRSLTPVLVAHLMTHVLADPILTQSMLHGVETMSR